MENNPGLVDQALFGYSDGHRQLASSVRLSSREMYDLAAASDLAAGVSLRGDESYLTGLPLRESALYALIKTWAAPEMPRPGCVWSHVLLLNRATLETQEDLSSLVALFRRPGAEEKGSFSSPINLDLDGARAIWKSDPNYSLIEGIIGQFYRGRVALIGPLWLQSEIEDSILSVWSQQWPKLREAFRFRTAMTSSRYRAGDSKFDVIISRGEEPSSEDFIKEDSREWIALGAADAVQKSFTPTRRFLWKYGSDVRSPRKRYQTLLRLQNTLEFVSPGTLPLSWAQSVFAAFPEVQDAKTLKRDILGVGTDDDPLCPSLSTVDFLRVSSTAETRELVDPAAVRARILCARDEEIAGLVSAYGELHGSLSELSDAIEVSLALRSTKKIVVDPSVPNWLRARILVARPDLIDAKSLAFVAIEDALPLLELLPNEMVTADLLTHWMQADPGAVGSKIVSHYPSVSMIAGIQAIRTNSLNRNWRPLFRQVCPKLYSLDISKVRQTSDLAYIIELLGFPIDDDVYARSFILNEAVVNAIDDVRDDLRAELLSYLSVVALGAANDSSLELLGFALPELRGFVRRNQLPGDARRLLQDHLPTLDYSNWDLDRRLLIALRNCFHRTGTVSNIAEVLPLSESDMAIVSGDESLDKTSSSFDLFRPWRW